MRARQGARRLVADQRHVLHPRQCARLRRLGPALRPGRLDLLRLPAVFSQGGDPRHRAERVSRRRWAAQCHHRQTRPQRPVRGDDRSRRAGRLSPHLRSQRLSAGRLRPDGPHRHARTAGGRARRAVISIRPRATESHHRHACADRPHAVRGQPRDRRRLFAEWEPGARHCAGAPRGAGVLRRDRVAATVAALGRGPAEWLRRLDVPVVLDLPGVGENLQDHLEIYIQYECMEPVSLAYALKPWNQPAIGANGCSWGRASAPATSSRPAASSAPAPSSPGRTSNITSCRWRSITTAAMP